MDGHMIQWDGIIELLLKLSGEVHIIRDAERLGYRPSTIRSPLAIISKEPEQEQNPERKKYSQHMDKESS